MTRARTARRLAGPLLLSAVIISLVLAVPPLRGVERQLSHVEAGWVIAAITLELGSCLAFIVIFRLFFDEPPPAPAQLARLAR